MKIFMDSPIKQRPGILRFLAILFWIGLWQLGALAAANPLILPSPVDTVLTLAGLLGQRAFYQSLFITLARVFGGIVVSVILGLVLGAVSGLNRTVYTFIFPFVTVVRTLPVVSISILLNLWLKSTLVPLAVTFLVCFPMVWTNVVEGIATTDPKLLEMASLYQVSFGKQFRHIYLPTLRPYITAGLISVIGMGWRSTVTSEVLANALPSVGMSLYYAKLYLETENLFAWTLMVIICSYAIEKLTVKVLKRQRAGIVHD